MLPVVSWLLSSLNRISTRDSNETVSFPYGPIDAFELVLKALPNTMNTFSLLVNNADHQNDLGDCLKFIFGSKYI